MPVAAPQGSAQARVEIGRAAALETSKRRRALALPLLCAATGGFLALLTSALADPQSRAITTGIAVFFFALGLAGLVSDEGWRGLRFFRLGAWLCLYASLAYGLATTTLSQRLLGQGKLLEIALTPRAASSVCLGLVVFVAAYRTTPWLLVRATHRVLSAGPARDRSQPREVPLLLIVYLTGLGVTAADAALGGGFGYIGGRDITQDSQVGWYTQLLTIGAFLRTAAVFALAARYVTSRRHAVLLTLSVLVLFEVTIGLLGATKESFVIVGLAVAIPIGLLRERRIPVVPLVAGALVFIFFVTPFVTDLRDDVRGSSGRLTTSEALLVGLDRLESSLRSPVSGTAESLDQVARRIRLIDNQIVIMQKTPDQFPYHPIRELALAPLTGLVPRVVWPDKPLRLSGLEFYKTYYSGEGISSSALTYQGSAYLYGGLLPELAAMLLLGYGVRAIDESRFRLDRMRFGLLALILFVPVVKQELEITTLWAAPPVFLITYYVAAFGVLKRHTQSARPASVGDTADSGRRDHGSVIPMETA